MGLRPTESDENLFGPVTTVHKTAPFPFCHPERTRISYFTALAGATDVVLSKENHTRLTEATTLDRESGEADLSRRAGEGSAVRHSGAPHLQV